MADNPQAFPHLEPRNPEFSYCANGMTLLDYFAGQALAGLCANSRHVAECHLSGPGDEPKEQSLVEKYAEYAYLVAAAMLNERQSHEG